MRERCSYIRKIMRRNFLYQGKKIFEKCLLEFWEVFADNGTESNCHLRQTTQPLTLEQAAKKILAQDCRSPVSKYFPPFARCGRDVRRKI
jgi:hypothetical protein